MTTIKTQFVRFLTEDKDFFKGEIKLPFFKRSLHYVAYPMEITINDKIVHCYLRFEGKPGKRLDKYWGVVYFDNDVMNKSAETLGIQYDHSDVFKKIYSKLRKLAKARIVEIRKFIDENYEKSGALSITEDLKKGLVFSDKIKFSIFPNMSKKDCLKKAINIRDASYLRLKLIFNYTDATNKVWEFKRQIYVDDGFYKLDGDYDYKNRRGIKRIDKLTEVIQHSIDHEITKIEREIYRNNNSNLLNKFVKENFGEYEPIRQKHSDRFYLVRRGQGDKKEVKGVRILITNFIMDKEPRVCIDGMLETLTLTQAKQIIDIVLSDATDCAYEPYEVSTGEKL